MVGIEVFMIMLLGMCRLVMFLFELIIVRFGCLLYLVVRLVLIVFWMVFGSCGRCVYRLLMLLLGLKLVCLSILVCLVSMFL